MSSSRGTPNESNKNSYWMAAAGHLLASFSGVAVSSKIS
jgi:hypothetical protein